MCWHPQARQVEESRSAANTTAAMPLNSTNMEPKATQPDQENGFWDKSIKQPAAEDSCAHHLQRFGKPPHALAATVPASTTMSDALQHASDCHLNIQGAACIDNLVFRWAMNELQHLGLVIWRAAAMVFYSCRLVKGALCIVMHRFHAGTQEALPNSGTLPSHQNTLEKLFANMKVCKDNTDGLT